MRDSGSDHGRRFLRWLHETEHQLLGLRQATDKVWVGGWRSQQRGRGQRTADWSIVDVDVAVDVNVHGRGTAVVLDGVLPRVQQRGGRIWCVAMATSRTCLPRSRPGRSAT